MTPETALALLKDGNERFLADAPIRPSLDRASRLRLATGQAPFAAYLSCSDSRVPPELLFGRGLGELFIVRNAGNTIGDHALGSIEFAVANLCVPLIVVMGHEGCGAIQAAIQAVDENLHFPGSIGRVIEPILPSVVTVRADVEHRAEAVSREHIRRMVRILRGSSSPNLHEPQQRGELAVVGAYYFLSSGVVDFFDLDSAPTSATT